MDTQRSGSPEEGETPRLRARIAELEKEINLIRGSTEPPGQRNADPLRDNGLYEETFNNISVCMFLVDVTADGRFRFAGFNPAEEKTVGLTNAQVSGKFVEDVFDEDVAEKLIANYRRCLEADTAINYDDELNLPAGRRYFHSNLIPIRNASGPIDRIVGACIDTTDFKRAQDEALARQKLESLGVLAGGIAHDFNNLLGSILAQAELAEMEVADGTLPHQEIQAIKSVTIRAGEIVRELLVYAGQDQAGLDLVDVSQLVEEMLELLKFSISKRIKLIVELRKDLPAVRANAVQIRQVVMNLITNASEALGDKEGVISVTTAKLESGDPFVVSQQELCAGGYLRLEVEDTGCGMTDEVLARIFDPFFTTKFAGRGLGLAAVQGIIRSHGGTINVVSCCGQGSRFEILLPCIDQPARATSDGAVQASGHKTGGDGGTVLMVEDEEILRIAVSKMLRKEGFYVIEAGDGSTAASLFRANESMIDVVLLDVTLPGMSSREVLQELRRIRQDVKVVLTSAFSQDKAISLIGEEPSSGYVRKPYQFSELGHLLRMACLGKSEVRGTSG